MSTGFREPTPAERRLLLELAAAAPGLGTEWVDGLTVRELSEGGMGSLELRLAGRSPSLRLLGRVAASRQFTDQDGVVVVATLNVDRDGIPFELDLWKTDLGPVIRLPEGP